MRYCTNCGAPATGAAFCTTCGARIDTVPTVPTVPTVSEPFPGPAEPGLAAQPARRPTAVPAVLGLLAVALAAGATTWFLVRDEPVDCALPVAVSDCDPSARDGVLTATGSPSPSGVATPTLEAGPNPVSPSPVAPAATTTPVPLPSPSAPLVGASGTPFWTVIVASKSEAEGGEAAAGAFAASLRAQGFDAELFHSSPHTSLRPGYWVAASGRYGSSAQAAAAAEAVTSAGFDIAYPRCVGTAEQCS